MSDFVYAVSSGDYSDYGVHCVFEREEDALRYVRILNRAKMDQLRKWYASNPNHVNPDHYTKDPDWETDFEYRIEKFQFWPAGVVPHAEAKL